MGVIEPKLRIPEFNTKRVKIFTLLMQFFLFYFIVSTTCKGNSFDVRVHGRKWLSFTALTWTMPIDKGSKHTPKLTREQKKLSHSSKSLIRSAYTFAGMACRRTRAATGRSRWASPKENRNDRPLINCELKARPLLPV